MKPSPANITQVDIISFMFPLVNNFPMKGDARATPKPPIDRMIEKVVRLIPNSFVTGSMKRLCKELMMVKPANMIKKPHKTINQRCAIFRSPFYFGLLTYIDIAGFFPCKFQYTIIANPAFLMTAKRQFRTNLPVRVHPHVTRFYGANHSMGTI